MAATLNTILIGEAVTVHVTLVDQFGNPASPQGPPPTWDTVDGGIVSVVGTLNPLEATVTGLASGSDVLTYTPDDAWGNPKTFTTPVTVLDANGFRLSLTRGYPVSYKTGLATPELTIDGSWDVDIVGVAVDARASGVDYSGGLTSILWSLTGTAAVFVTLLTSPPVESTTISGTLSVTLRTKAEGDVVLTLTATNSIGQTISLTVNVRVLGMATASFAIV